MCFYVKFQKGKQIFHLVYREFPDTVTQFSIFLFVSSIVQSEEEEEVKTDTFHIKCHSHCKELCTEAKKRNLTITLGKSNGISFSTSQPSSSSTEAFVCLFISFLLRLLLRQFRKANARSQRMMIAQQKERQNTHVGAYITVYHKIISIEERITHIKKRIVDTCR